MIGKSTIIWIGVACAASGILYQTSYKAQEQERELASLNRQIQQERASIQVLKAEWAYLNDPAALEKLSRDHLVLGPTKADQIALLTDIPEKLPADLAPVPMGPIPGRKPGYRPALPPAEAQVAAVPAAERPSLPVMMVNYGGGQ